MLVATMSCTLQGQPSIVAITNPFMMACNKHKGFPCSRKEGQLTWRTLGKSF